MAGVSPPWGHWFRQAEVRPDHGRVVMQGAEGQPLLVLDRKGKGRVALLTSDHAWLWARGYDGGGPHTDLLRRLSHWLMKEPDLEEERLIATAKGLKLSIERRTMDDAKVSPVTISAPGGERSEIKLEKKSPGLWRADLDVKLPGLYKAETPGPSGALTAVAHAGIEDPREMSEVVATEQKLKPIADATGGGNVLDACLCGCVGNIGRCSAGDDDVGRQGAGGFELAWSQGSRRLRDARRQAYADDGRVTRACDAACADVARLVARRKVGGCC